MARLLSTAPSEHGAPPPSTFFSEPEATRRSRTNPGPPRFTWPCKIPDEAEPARQRRSMRSARSSMRSFPLARVRILRTAGERALRIVPGAVGFQRCSLELPPIKALQRFEVAGERRNLREAKVWPNAKSSLRAQTGPLRQRDGLEFYESRVPPCRDHQLRRTRAASAGRWSSGLKAAAVSLHEHCSMKLHHIKQTCKAVLI